MPVIPFHQYIGPGNSVNNGEPIDTGDAIAEIHDRQYASARNVDDIRQADRSAISAFAEDAIVNQRYCSAIGAVGIGTKYALESLTGVIYPNMKRAADSSENVVSPPKKGKGIDHNLYLFLIMA